MSGRRHLMRECMLCFNLHTFFLVMLRRQASEYMDYTVCIFASVGRKSCCLLSCYNLLDNSAHSTIVQHCIFIMPPLIFFGLKFEEKLGKHNSAFSVMFFSLEENFLDLRLTCGVSSKW